MRISLHPEFGLNPSLLKCFWCGQETGALALLGAFGGKEAPRYMVANLEPCDSCKANFEKGVLFIEVQTSSDLSSLEREKRFKLGNAYPTGSHIVLTPEGAEKIIVDPALLEEVLKSKKCLLAPDAFASLKKTVTQLMD